ncbi:MAG: TatD family hydrolase [Oscillospiraceae bacterium]|nr:TatD family hydrolase [Oscillospiraceae bacterium]
MDYPYNNIFDSHAHYESKRFDPDRAKLLNELPGRGVRYVLNAASDFESAEAGIKLAEEYGYIYASAGFHPHETKKATPGFTAKLAELLRRPKVQAVGEIGLDYHYDFSPQEVQRRVFEEQLALAVELDLPVIVHDREAHYDTLALLKKYKPAGVVHCYSGSAEMARELLSIGFYIGFTGVVTFKNARKVLEAARAVPIDRLLIETDCPYMAPEPQRGRRCDSGLLGYTAQALAREKGIDTQALIDRTCQNAMELYRII